MVERIIKAAKERNADTVAVLGVTFKPNTDDVRESPALTIIKVLQEAGLTVRAHDPEGEEQAKKVLDNIVWCSSPYEAAKGAAVLTIITEWNAYRALDLKKLAKLMPGGKIIDLRNIYKKEEFEDIDLDYMSIGR